MCIGGGLQMRRKIYQLLISLVATVAVFLAGGLIFNNVTAHAAEVLTSGLQAGDATITDVNGNAITNGSQLDKWTSYSVSYNWSIPDGQAIATGDTATVHLPEGAVAEHDTTVSILDDTGREVGIFTIKAGETTGSIMFNDAFASVGTNRRGTLQFYVKGTTYTGGDGEDWGLNKIGWISEKNPDGSPSKLTWNIAFNPMSQNVGSAVVTDTLGPNQEFIPGSVVAETGEYVTKSTFVSSGTTTPTVSQNGNQLTFTFANVTTAINMTYQTRPTTLENGGSWTNQASWDGRTVGSQIAWGGSGSGTGDATTGEVILNKQASANGEMLAGAVYRLQQTDGTVVASNLTTDANGQIIYSDLASGNYEFVEVTPPAGFALNETPIPFTIEAGQTTPVEVFATDEREESEGPGTGGTPENPENPENPGNPGNPEPENPENPEDPETPENPENPTPENPEPENPENPAAPEEPENPEPGNPGNPEAPVSPEPGTPEVPGQPEPGTTTPSVPEKPQEPETQKPTVTQPQQPTQPGTTTGNGSSTTAGNGVTAGAGANGTNGTNGTDSTTSGQQSGATSSNGHAAAHTTAPSASGKLPQTGNRENPLMFWLGIGLLIITGLGYGVYRRQK